MGKSGSLIFLIKTFDSDMSQYLVGSKLKQDPSFHFLQEDATSSICVILLTDKQTNRLTKLTNKYSVKWYFKILLQSTHLLNYKIPTNRLTLESEMVPLTFMVYIKNVIAKSKSKQSGPYLTMLYSVTGKQ